ncbi:MAG TPA: AMP-binding protein [Usitatibacter sp.]|nr:AMP-binding protein [Usitatibacter sp.]
MSSVDVRPRSSSGSLPLTGHGREDAIAAWRAGRPITAGELLAEVARVSAALPDRSHILNLCTDRYRFAVMLLAAVARGQLTLLPPAATPHLIRAMLRFAPDAYFVTDDPAIAVDLPRFDMPASAPGKSCSGPPLVPADREIACLFTSGSTGEPQPSYKTWGAMVHDAVNEAARLAIGPGHAILGTVPAQHMYGFESTILLPLVSGAALTAERPYYPGDIDRAIEAVPAPRVLFTTPFHLRAWLGADDPARVEAIVSATAPLSLDLAGEAERRTGAQLHEIYGCTEAGQVATRRPTVSSDWQLYPGIRLHVHEGRATVSGAHIEAPIALQDVIEARPDGIHFALHGRFSDMVNIAGKRNSLAYLNHQLASIEGVVDGVFFVPEEREADAVTRLTAFVVAPGLTRAQVIAALRERIDPAFLPRPLVMVERLPRQLTGKLPHAELRALAARGRRAPKAS